MGARFMGKNAGVITAQVEAAYAECPKAPAGAAKVPIARLGKSCFTKR